MLTLVLYFPFYFCMTFLSIVIATSSSHILDVRAEGVHMTWVAHRPRHVISEAEYVVCLVVVSLTCLHFEGEHGKWRRAIVNHNQCPSPLVPLERGTCFGNREIFYMVTKFYLNFLVYLKREGGVVRRGDTRRRPTAVVCLDMWL